MIENPLIEGEYLIFKYPDDLNNKDRLFHLSIECNFCITDKTLPFDAKKINYYPIVKIDKNNKEYLNEFLFLFCKPTEEEIIEHLIKEGEFEEIMKIKNGEKYSSLLTKEECRLKSFELVDRINKTMKK